MFVHPMEVKCCLRVRKKIFGSFEIIIIGPGIDYFGDGYKIGKLIFFGNLSVLDFSFDEFALLAAPENRNYSESDLNHFGKFY